VRSLVAGVWGLGPTGRRTAEKLAALCDRVLADDRHPELAPAGVEAGTAALDVFPAEPEVPAALLSRPDVILTPHIAFSSAHSVLELRRRSTADLLRVLAGVPPLNPVALPGG
jgi:phosphoglycerate dehydrogenase-like enzyme